MLATRGGLLGNNPKEILATVDAERFGLDWFDTEQAVADLRNIVLHLGDHWCATSAMVHTRTNIDHLIGVLGTNARHIAG